MKLSTENLKRLLFVLSFCMGLFLIVNGYNTLWHEQVHYKINNDYGVKSEMSYSFLMMGGETIPLENETVTNDNRGNYELAHNLNEIIGYNVQSIIFLLVVMTGVIMWKR